MSEQVRLGGDRSYPVSTLGVDRSAERRLAHRLETGMRVVAGGVMHRENIFDDLRRLESEVVEGERRLAEQEALVVALKKRDEDRTEAEAVLEMMRRSQQQLDQDRQRLLSLLRP